MTFNTFETEDEDAINLGGGGGGRREFFSPIT